MMTNKEWENSKKIHYPKTISQEAGLTPDDNLIFPCALRHKTLEERIRESGCELTGIGEIDWGDPQGNEVW